MNLLNKYHTNNRFIFPQNVWMAYSREMLNCDIEKNLNMTILGIPTTVYR